MGCIILGGKCHAKSHVPVQAPAAGSRWNQVKENSDLELTGLQAAPVVPHLSAVE